MKWRETNLESKCEDDSLIIDNNNLISSNLNIHQQEQQGTDVIIKHQDVNISLANYAQRRLHTHDMLYKSFNVTNNINTSNNTSINVNNNTNEVRLRSIKKTNT